MKNLSIVAIDIGNGYIKRTYDGKNVMVDPATFSYIQAQQFSLSNWDNIISINGQEAIYGQEAVLSKGQLHMPLGEQDVNRYETEEFKDMVLATLALDRKQNMLIEKLVLGLPIQHMKFGKADILKKVFEHKEFDNIQCNDSRYKIAIKEVIVMPQPMGSFFYYTTKQKEPIESILIIDGGFGTIDYTEIHNNRITYSDGNDNGVKRVYAQLQEQLMQQYVGAKYTLYDVEKAIRNGFVKYKGKQAELNTEVLDMVLKLQFNVALEPIVHKYGSYVDFDVVLFTGGFTEVFRNEILHLQQDNENIVLCDKPQAANVLGYYTFGR